MTEFVPFRFRVSLYAPDGPSEVLLCQGSFSEVSGLEATMTPKVISEGGRNWGEIQLAGPTKFAPIVLKRGMTEVNDLYDWFDVTTRQANYASRMTGIIEVYDSNRDAGGQRTPVLTWQLSRAMATKFKGADLSSTASQVAIEELQLVHEGLTLLRKPATGSGNG